MAYPLMYLLTQNVAGLGCASYRHKQNGQILCITKQKRRASSLSPSAQPATALPSRELIFWPIFRVDRSAAWKASPWLPRPVAGSNPMLKWHGQPPFYSLEFFAGRSPGSNTRSAAATNRSAIAGSSTARASVTVPASVANATMAASISAGALSDGGPDFGV